MEEKGIATEIKESIRGVKNFFFELFGKGENKKTYQDNEDVIYDEILFGAWIVALICTGVTMWFGVAYHLSIFSLSTDPSATKAVILSIGVLVIGEFVKMYFGLRAGRMLFIAKKDGKSKLAKLGLWIVLTGLVVVAFIWSMDISSIAYGSNTANAKRQEALLQTGDYSGVTKEYDTQIAQINESIKKANKQTWNGKLTPDAIDLIKSLSKDKNRLVAQKNKAIDLATSKDSTFMSITGGEIKQTEERLNSYGGKAEYLLIILVFFVIPVCEKILYTANMGKKNENDDDDQTGAGGTQGGTQFFSMQQRSTPAFNTSKPIVESKVERTPIGFKYSGEKKAEDSKKIVDDKKKRPNITRKL